MYCRLLLLSVLAVFSALGEDYLWKAEIGNKRVYLGGSVHYLRSQDYPIPAIFDSAFNDSKTLVLEADMDLSETQQVQSYITTQALLPSGRLLQNIVPGNTYKAVQRFALDHGYISTAFDGYRPWFVNTFFANLTYADLGFSADLGVDRKYLNLAKNQNKNRQFLETPQEAISALASVPESESVKSLNSQAELINKGLLPSTEIGDLIKAWKSGQPELYDPVLLKMSSEYPQTFDKIVKNRNLLWLPKIENLFKQPDRAFVLVGALHYSGEVSLLKLLSSKGYSISRAAGADFLPNIMAVSPNLSKTVGQPAALTVDAISGTALSYQWKKSGVPVANGNGISGATTASLSFSSVQLAHAGDYSVTVSNSAGSVTSSVATLTVTPALVAPSIVTQPSSVTVTQGEAAEFSLTAAGSAPLSYQWQKEGQNVVGATAASFLIPSTQATSVGNYRVVVSNSAGSVASATVTLTIKPAVAGPVIVVQPVSSAVSFGQQIVLSVQAAGTAPLGYQWQKAGVNIAGAAAAQLVLKSVSINDAGEYRVVVTNPGGTTISSVAVVAVLPQVAAPSITSQPINTSIVAGQALELRVTATGAPIPNYQWRRNGVDLIGATGPILSIPAATFEHAGTYQVLVFNSGGQVLSDKAIVTVESVGPRIPVAGMSIRMVPEVTTLGDENTQWSLEWAPSLSPDAPWFALTNFTMTRSGSKVIDLSDAQPGRFYRSIGGYLGVPPSMAVIPEGSFQMGAAIVGVGPVHTVYVSRFLIDRYEVSKDLWDNVRSWAISKNYDLPVGSSFDGPLQPIHSVSWYDAVKWCNARSEKEGIIPAYYSDAGLRVVYRAGQIQPYLKKNTGYRLPTEAEWEKAARGGYSDKSYPWPDGFSISPSMANYNDTGLGKTAPVSSYPANGYGVYNISGNVWEWCWDYYGAYSAGNQTDPLGASQGNARVIRGGGWDNADNFCRVFSRISNGNPTSRGNSLGFRTVRSGQ